jgi:hypothetical protein
VTEGMEERNIHFARFHFRSTARVLLYVFNNFQSNVNAHSIPLDFKKIHLIEECKIADNIALTVTRR